MTSEQDRKLVLLETLVNNQKHVIELLSMLNNNVEELILDIKDIKNNQKYETSNNLSLPTSSSCSDLDLYDNKEKTESNNSQNNNLINTDTETISNDCENHVQNIYNNIKNHQLNQIHSQEINHHGRIDIDKYNNSAINNKQTNSTKDNNSPFLSNQNNYTHMNNDSHSKNIVANNNDNYKSVKTGLREFSTFVSKTVRQEFGSNFLAITRINELDRYVMQKIRDEAISKYLPNGISPQFAWNHAMNSLRQLRHRQCKKAKINLSQVI